jgi:hypothetical protein
MKTLLYVILLASSLVCNPVNSAAQTNINRNANTGRRASDNNNKAGEQRVTLNEQNISFILPTGWRRGKAPGFRLRPGEDSIIWLGPDRTMISIDVGFAGNLSRSIEQETDAYYRTHRNREDARLLEINGVRGVHYLVDYEWSYLIDDERPHQGFEMELSRFIRWQGLRMHRGRRQNIVVQLSAPVRSFSGHRDTLYGILNSIRFIRE